MQASEYLDTLRRLTSEAPGCDYLSALRQAASLIDSASPEARDEFSRALLVLLARHETINNLRLSLTREWNLTHARHVLLAHLYSPDFYPQDPAVASAWTDILRAQLCLTLAHLAAEPAIPVLNRELKAWTVPAPRGLAAAFRRMAGDRSTRPTLTPIVANEPPVPERTFREFMILFQSAAMLDTPRHRATILLALDADERYGLPASGGASFALYAFVGALLALRGATAPLNTIVNELPPASRRPAERALAAAVDMHADEFPDQTP